MCLLDEESLILLFSRGGILEMSTWNMGAGYVHLNGNVSSCYFWLLYCRFNHCLPQLRYAWRRVLPDLILKD